ncbi:uncharacterized protein LOC110693752 [Chenopodium quinoa]|uniref:uncharacterized protein LOC110693752 n=1 Tax=Chenopodium quinoa TaxID=63459 RepID=UPI000B76F450|nr:uncharacterized protein LOC110693752 [Chenopodium quinoa]
MANHLLSFTLKFALLAFFMLTMAGPMLGRLQPTTETNPEVMKAIIHELGKEQLAAYYGLDEPKLAMVVEPSPYCSRKYGLCRQSSDCCEGLTCKRIKYPDWACS